MYDILKLRLLNEVMSKSIPQKVDYEVHNSEYRVELLSIHPITYNCIQYRELSVSGNLEKDTITAALYSEKERLFAISDLPYIARSGDRTPIYQIIRASVLFAYGAMQLPYLYRSLKKIPLTDYPFWDKYEDREIKKEIRFMQNLSKACEDKGPLTASRATVIHRTSSKLKEIISFYDEENDKEAAICKKIQESMDALKPYASTKKDGNDAVPDVFEWNYMPETPKGAIDTRVFILNTNPKDKNRFWWDYLKLNLYLSDVEYSFGYCLLMNHWKISTIQKWIAEYREKGYFESKRAQDYMAFYVKNGEKTAVRILNSDGTRAKIRLARRLPF